MIAKVRSGYLVLLLRSFRSDDYWSEVEPREKIEIVPLVCAFTVESLCSLKQSEPMLPRLGRERFVQDRVSGTGIFAGGFITSVESRGA